MNVEKFKCHSSVSVVEAMKKIDASSCGIVYIVDDSDVLIGCVTDGDIRRWIINGGKLKTPISRVMNSTPIYVFENQDEEGYRLMAEQGITSIAVINIDYHIVDVLFASPRTYANKINNQLTGIPVIVMAGGKGTRLYPYTKILPKPLIPVGEVPILERVFERFAQYGVNDFYLTINYRKEMIKAYFAETSHMYNLHFIEELIPLGTAGSIRLIEDRFDSPVIVTNCDILIEADYSDVLHSHISSCNDLTIVSSLKNTVIPYGVINAGENGIITSMEEKPELSYFVNTGMYILNPEFIKWIPENVSFHMTELVELMIERGKKVGMYPIGDNSFLDMGEFAEMKRMEERISAGFVEC